MEASDLKCDLPDSSTGQKSLDLKTAHVNKKLVVKAGKGVKRKSSSLLESSKRRRRNNPASNRLGPERINRRKNKANLSPPKHHAHSHGLQTIDSDVDPMKNKNNGFLSDDMVVPKKSLDICRQNTADNGDSLNISIGDRDDHRDNSNYEIDANELSNNVASPSQHSSDYKEKSGLLINIALPSQATNSKAMKETTIDKNVSSNNEVSPSKVSRKTKKKPTNSKDEMQGASLSSFQVSNGKKNKKEKSSSLLNKSCNNTMSHSQASNGTRNRKSNDADVRHRMEKNTPLERKDNIKNSSAFDGKIEYVNGNNSEEDLEENAAWMLSSRFDTTFAGFSGNSSSSMSQSANGIQGNFEHKNESTSVDDLGRMLRPRNPNGQSLVRKRRHFYEVSYKDMDPYSILKQRIRVYWPLDQIWYFGLVKDYDPETKLHHVKYDDRDEEWINLQHERFKLLLYPSEVSGKVRSRKSRAGLNKKSREGDIKEASGAILEDSVPIIAWLAEPKLRKKLTSANKKTSLGESGEAHMVTDNTSVSDRELSYVYSRKKFRKRRQGYDKELDEDFIHGNSSSSINILASVADSALVLEELNVFGSLMELKQVTFKINFHFQCIDHSTFGMEGPCFRILYLLEYGTLVNTQPMVHVDIVLVDNTMGLRLFLFYGPLKCVIELLCSVIRMFDGEGKFKKLQVPCTSIGINLSGKFLFLLYRFLTMERCKLRYLENKLRNQCLTMRAVPVEECTFSTIKNLQEDGSRMLCSSMFKDAVTSECSPEKALNLDMDPKTCPTNAIHAELSCSHLATMSLHINSLIESNAPPDNAQKHEICHEGSADLNEKSSTEDPSEPVSDITMENVGASLGQIDAIPSVNHLKVDTDALSVNNDGNWMPCIHIVNNTDNSTDNRDVELNKSDETVQDADKPNSLYPGGYSSPDKNKFQPVHVEERSIHSPNPTAPRSIRRNIQGTISPKNGHHLKSWNNDFMGYGFVSGNKKPRTQVSYSLPFGGFDLGAKRRSHQRKARPYKKFDSFSAHNLLDPLTCNANVLVTSMDKGWREYGAQIVLESDDQKDWKICVKFSGVTKYTYKAQHLLQPGITNRYTHAMMWKGGKDWTLEFTDRNQWFVFKEIHEECHNRNLQASYVKNIPIPGVRLIENDCDDLYGVPFVRNSYEYHRIVGTEVDMALDPAYVLYDMDTDDEKWVSEMRSTTYMMEKGFSKITDEVFEKVIDNFEKFAYAQQCEEFSEDEIEEFMDDIGSPEIVKTIYEYWRKKRMKKGMPLIRQFQPALWEVYQKQLKEWESSMSRMQNLNNGCAIKKPQMFAFCLRPRGLEAPNKSLKQRSQRKFVSKGCHRAFAREPSMSHTSGRRTNGHVERISISSYESSDSYHSNDDSDRSQCVELHRANSKKKPKYVSPRDPNTITPFSQSKKPKKNNIFEAPNNVTHIQRDSLRRQRTDIHEFKLRDALNLANHASTIAKMKREKARLMMHKANLAIHKATAALMMAEAMKDSEKHLFNEYEEEEDDDDSDEVESEDDETEEDIDSDEDEDMDEDI